jgi:hypothetical protein
MAIYDKRSATPEAGLKDLFLTFAVGAAGAVGAYDRRQGFGACQPANANSLAAATVASPGVYTLNLDQRWQGLLDLNAKVIGAVVAASGVHAEITSVNLNQAQPTVVITMRRTDTGAAADPPNGSKLNIHLQLKDSTV